MKKVLIVTSVASMIDQFNRGNIKILQELGYHVDVACNFREGNTCSEERAKELWKELKAQQIGCYQIDFDRNVYHLPAVRKAYRQLRQVCRNQYAFMHCQSPIGGVLGRLVAARAHIPVIYTAHGFHFYTGASWKNWLLYYPVERILANKTQLLITLNHEDYHRAVRRHLAKKVVYVPGVGVDTERFHPPGEEERAALRKRLHVREDETLVLSVGELTKRKNHLTALHAIAECKDPTIRYCICGIGELEGMLRKKSRELGISRQVIFAGYQEKVEEYYGAADIFLFPSLQEGLPVALMEAMACGLPVICSDIRGSRELIDEQGGRLVMPRDIEGYTKFLHEFMRNAAFYSAGGAYNRVKVMKFGNGYVNERIRKIYVEMKRTSGRA